MKLKTHKKTECAGAYCCIHNPSDHPLKAAPLHWREDKNCMERICKHGVGHPKVLQKEDIFWDMSD